MISKIINYTIILTLNIVSIAQIIKTISLIRSIKFNSSYTHARTGNVIKNKIKLILLILSELIFLTVFITSFITDFLVLYTGIEI